MGRFLIEQLCLKRTFTIKIRNKKPYNKIFQLSLSFCLRINSLDWGQRLSPRVIGLNFRLTGRVRKFNKCHFERSLSPEQNALVTLIQIDGSFIRSVKSIKSAAAMAENVAIYISYNRGQG